MTLLIKAILSTPLAEEIKTLLFAAFVVVVCGGTIWIVTG